MLVYAVLNLTVTVRNLQHQEKLMNMSRDKQAIMRGIICRAMYVISPCSLRIDQMWSCSSLYVVECFFSHSFGDSVTSRWGLSLDDIEVICECFSLLDDLSSIHSRDEWCRMLDLAKSMAV